MCYNAPVSNRKPPLISPLSIHLIVVWLGLIVEWWIPCTRRYNPFLKVYRAVHSHDSEQIWIMPKWITPWHHSVPIVIEQWMVDCCLFFWSGWALFLKIWQKLCLFSDGHGWWQGRANRRTDSPTPSVPRIPRSHPTGWLLCCIFREVVGLLEGDRPCYRRGGH